MIIANQGIPLETLLRFPEAFEEGLREEDSIIKVLDIDIIRALVPYVQVQDTKIIQDGIEKIRHTHIDATQYQRDQVLRFKNNYHIDRALRGIQTVAQGYDELSRHRRGWRALIPHRRDNIHNERVKEMEALIGDTSYLEKGDFLSLFSPSAPPNTFVYSTVATHFLLRGLLTPNMPNSQVLKLALSAAIVPTIIALFCRYDLIGCYKEGPRYIDDKISELKYQRLL